MPRKIEISHKTVIFIFAFLLGAWFLYYIRDIILELFVAILIMAVLDPLVTKLEKFKIPRALSILVAYILTFGLLGTAIAGLIPPLVDQTSNLVANLGSYISYFGNYAPFGDQIVKEILPQLGNIPGQIVRFGFSIFSNIFSVLTVLFFAFYLLLAKNKFRDQLGNFVEDKISKEIIRIIDLLEIKLGSWARGELALMFLVGILNYIGLKILGVPYALPLAILNGMLEIIPYLGPTLAAVPTVIIGFNISPVMGLATASLAFLVQQIENYLFVPKVMEKSVGVHPIITLLALAIGARLAGIVGILISVPAVIASEVLITEYLRIKSEQGSLI